MVELPPLPFAQDELEPYMSQRTLEFHYGKHHKKYVDNTNKLIKETEYEKLPLEEIMLRSHNANKEIFNNSAQAWNHTFFWNCLAKGTTASPTLKDTIRKSFGSFEDFQKQFNEKATKLFGSGWTWLARDADDTLVIVTTKDAENPMTEGELPVLTCDVWEHAYYLDYQNDRANFLENFWNIVNWDFVEKNVYTQPNRQNSRQADSIL